ncbi:hypothetical protein EIP86_002518 [Pleurotus ostreatoroseus]|nr:hypothetical protein EIP86_002518 [Pleurotus ostreatoroseus]
MAIHPIVPTSTHQSPDVPNSEDTRPLLSSPQCNLSLFHAYSSPYINLATPSLSGLEGAIVAYSLDTHYIAELYGYTNPQLYDKLFSMSVGSYLGFVSFVCKYEPGLRTRPTEYVINFVGRKTSVLADMYSPVAPLRVPVISLIDPPTANCIDDLAVWTTIGTRAAITQLNDPPSIFTLDKLTLGNLDDLTCFHYGYYRSMPGPVQASIAHLQVPTDDVTPIRLKSLSSFHDIDPECLENPHGIIEEIMQIKQYVSPAHMVLLSKLISVNIDCWPPSYPPKKLRVPCVE